VSFGHHRGRSTLRSSTRDAPARAADRMRSPPSVWAVSFCDGRGRRLHRHQAASLARPCSTCSSAQAASNGWSMCGGAHRYGANGSAPSTGRRKARVPHDVSTRVQPDGLHLSENIE